MTFLAAEMPLEDPLVNSVMALSLIVTMEIP
jgi:hypothetical protein